MYWYVKYPIYFLLLCALALGIIGITRTVMKSAKGKTAAPVQQEETAPQELPDMLPGNPIVISTEPSPAGNPPAETPASVPTVQQGKLPSISASQPEVSQLLNASPRQAREQAYAVLEGTAEFSPEWLQAAQIVNEANRIFMNSNAPAPEKTTYVIRPGDSLSAIARKFHTTVGALQRLNERAPSNYVIHPDQKLRMISGQWSIRVSKSNFLLCLYYNQKLYRIYPISTGKHDRTPAGTFIIFNKSAEPEWNPEPGKVIPFGSPDNILGTRWMGLRPAGNTETDVTGLGIHGTTSPESIGTASSLGCIRLRNQDVEELYDFIPEPGNSLFTPVVILE